MATVTSRDLQEIVSKLSSDKAKTREEGIKLLNTWLEGERSTGFVRYIGQKTAMLKPSEIRHSESWPFLITLLTKCVTLEISSSKRRLPKLIFAKLCALLYNEWRIPVFQLFDASHLRPHYPLTGRNLHLVSVAKLLFNHIWDVLKDVPSFQHEYGIILRHLLVVRDYRVHMRVRVYCSLVIFHIEKVRTNLSVKNSTQSNPKEDVFRCILTLHSLLENPPGDFPSNLREDIVKGIVTIFSFVRDEGKLSRKLIECVNTYLLKDGPNLGCQSLEIHDAVKQFAFRCWTTTHDRGLKDALVLYARLQLNLTRGAADGSELAEHLLDVVGKELDQNSICSTNLAWSDTTKDDKCGNLTSSQCGVVELAALVFYRACLHTTKAPSAEKRARKEHAAAYIREGIMNGRWLCTWSDLIKGEVCDRIAAFCCLSRNYGTRISKDLFAYWFDGICASFERIMNDATVSHTYDCLLWALRSLHQLSSVLLLSVPRMEASSNETDRGWHTIWRCLMSGLPVFSNVASVADAALIVLGDIISNGDLRDSLHLRQNLLRAVLALVNWQDCPMLNEGLVRFLPAAVFALCAGCAPLPLDCKELFPYHSSMDVLVEECIKGKDHENDSLHELFECSVEVLAKIDHGSVPEVCQSHCYQNVRLPHQLRVSLLQEMETYILEALLDKELEQKLLCDLFYKCALLSSFMFGSYITRVTEEVSPFFAKMGQHLLKLLDCAISVIEKSHNDARTDQNVINVTVYTALSQSIERLLKALVKLYEECSPSATNFQSEIELPDFPASISCVPTSPSNSSISMIMDMELDLCEDSKDLDAIAVGRKTVSGVSVSSGLWKFHIISSFFEVLPVVAWEILFDLMEKENEANVSSMNNFVDLRTNLKLQCSIILVAIYDLLGTLISLDTCGKDTSTVGKGKNAVTSLRERISEQSLILLRDLLNRVAENDLFDWSGRSKLIDCISNFIVVRPHIGQTMIEKLLRMLQDPDYRVRFSLAKRIGTLFQTWDGHDDLFQDIWWVLDASIIYTVGQHDRSNFGAKLVVSSKEKVVTAKEVLATGPQPHPTMETIIITLMHLAMFSEKIELEAVFMMCVISAIDPSQRELVVAALDNLSRQLQYTSRSKYLEELMGSILFSWVACGVSLVSLVEVAHQQATHLVKNYFVPIFSVCMALHCSKKSGWENEAMVLQSSILRIADISENERDKLVKKHMVSIVSHIFSLASSESDPMLPFFSKEAIVHTIQTVVDGFLNMEERCRSSGVIGMIKIFRPDRVFMFIIEMHYKVTAAVHPRHKCHRLAGIEVLISILGHRAAHSSTFNYLFNVAGLFVCCNGLQDQCCCIISSLLQTYRSSPSKETAGVLGEQLQYLVSKLVGCCIPLVPNSDLSGTQSSQVLSLLNQLTVDSDPSLHDYIKELEPFPELDEFDGLRKFQQQLCQDYSPKEHLIKFVKRSCYLPPRLLLCSLKALHKKLVMGVIHQREGKTEIICAENDWCCDKQSVQAVWRLVRMCGLGEGNSLLAWVSDLISKCPWFCLLLYPHSVVFHLPGESGQTHFCPRLYPENSTEANFHLDTGISEELLVSLMRLLKKYLMDDSVKIIDMTSQTIQVSPL
ncbi:hypothetical protein RHMOL_Rhmol08G0188500 [Rhododendron molle]|uniref:Uncharacterized protein n=1 Tax=Rhododendron molle TaxID=49168 RepID=A0ACC0MPR1_RHOML|nr:hypothetical protein RHMOL_Rhmol08G0188500 [Rhododendron molle]